MNNQQQELDITEKTITIENLYKDHIRQIRFDLAIQRGKAWSLLQKSLFIHTILVGYRFPEVYSQNKSGNWFILDGKQRLTTVFDFLDDKFPLHVNTPNVYGQEVGECLFTELPEKYRRKILSTVFRLVFFENMTVEQRDEMFYRLNNGTPLNTFEKARSRYSAMIKDAQKLARMPLFTKQIIFTDRGKEKLVDQQLIYCLSLLHDKGRDNKGITNKAIESYINELKIENRSIDVESLKEIFLYMEQAFEGFTFADRKKILNAKNLVAIFQVARRCVLDNTIEPRRFGAFILDFFYILEKDSLFELTKGKGSMTRDNINKRIAILDDHFHHWVMEDKLEVS